ncbi:Uncharacterised protein [uncultured archaeon]|nr:Uncharacterised protein [uncultured archaeon]
MPVDHMEKSYVGVTGLTSKTEVVQVSAAFHEHGFSLQADHVPMAGFLVSDSTLRGGGTRNLRYPSLKDLPGLLEASAKREMFTTVHYSTSDASFLSKQMETLLAQEGIYERNLCQGVQFNIVCPDPREIGAVKKQYPELKVIVQLSRRMMDAGIEQAALRVSQDYPMADYVLIDPSGGNAIQFDPLQMAKVFMELKGNGVAARIGVAGGLDGSNVKSRLDDLTLILRKKYGATQNFSIDAEGALRDRAGEGYGNDVLNARRVRSYIGGAAKGLLQDSWRGSDFAKQR